MKPHYKMFNDGKIKRQNLVDHETIYCRVPRNLKRKVVKAAAIAGISVNAFVVLTLSANAACYHYTIWHYPYPQPCLVHPAVQAARPAPPAQTALIPDIIVPILPLTPAQAATLTDDEQRQMGLDALRPLLDELVNGEQRE